MPDAVDPSRELGRDLQRCARFAVAGDNAVVHQRESGILTYPQVRNGRGSVLVRRGRLTVVIVALLVAGVGCSSGGGGHDPVESAAAASFVTTPGAAGLRKAARQYTQAFLTGSASEIVALRQDASCMRNAPRGSVLAPKAMLTALSNLQKRVFPHLLGRPLADVHVTSVAVSEVTATHGLADAVLDVPDRAGGNDNWLDYVYVHGHWQVDDCRIPFGGNGESGQASSAPPG